MNPQPQPEPVAEPDSTRDPHPVLAVARRDWVLWHPGDGSRYWVRLLKITRGTDHADTVLLVNNCVGDTVAFQYPTAEYRRQGRLWSRKRARREGLGNWWAAAGPLLAAEGALEAFGNESAFQDGVSDPPSGTPAFTDVRPAPEFL